MFDWGTYTYKHRGDACRGKMLIKHYGIAICTTWRERQKTALFVGLERWQTGTWEVQPCYNYTDTQLFKMFSLPTFLVRSHSNGASCCVLKEFPCPVIIPPPPPQCSGDMLEILCLHVWPSVQALFRRTSLPFVTRLGIVKRRVMQKTKTHTHTKKKQQRNQRGKKLGCCLSTWTWIHFALYCNHL